MKITAKDVQYAARLSRLELNPGETEYFTRQLNDIMEYIAKLSELNTEGVAPTYHALPLVNVFRKDEAKASIDPEDILAQAPDRKGSTFRVPKIIEG